MPEAGFLGSVTSQMKNLTAKTPRAPSKQRKTDMYEKQLGPSDNQVARREIAAALFLLSFTIWRSWRLGG